METVAGILNGELSAKLKANQNVPEIGGICFENHKLMKTIVNQDPPRTVRSETLICSLNSVIISPKNRFFKKFISPHSRTKYACPPQKKKKNPPATFKALKALRVDKPPRANAAARAFPEAQNIRL